MQRGLGNRGKMERWQKHDMGINEEYQTRSTKDGGTLYEWIVQEEDSFKNEKEDKNKSNSIKEDGWQEVKEEVWCKIIV